MSFIYCQVNAQIQSDTTKVHNAHYRINIINPSFGIEKFIANTKLSLSAEIGYGINASEFQLDNTFEMYKNQASLFLDVQLKHHYNRNVKRNISHFVSFRSLNEANFNVPKHYISIDNQNDTYTKYTFGIGPTWGIQKVVNNVFYMMFDIGPMVFFDVDGYYRWTPVNLQINIGFNIK